MIFAKDAKILTRKTLNLQTITGAMSTLTPPIPLEHPENQVRVDYIQDVASSHDFDYPPVSNFHQSVLHVIPYD